MFQGQPSKWWRRKSYQMRTKSTGSFIQDPGPHRRTMENLSCTSHLPRKSATTLSQFEWYLGRSTCHAQRPFDRKSFSTSCARRAIKGGSKWLKYFAPDLLPRNKWYRRRENLREGDLVLEMEPTPRRTWKMAVVLETFPGDDGLVRKAKIKTANAVYGRPIHKLCLICYQRGTR